MNRKRLLVGLQIGTGLILAGLGHLYVAFLRDVYPLDGYVLYALALILLWRGWRTIRRAPDPVWAALLDSLHAAWRVMADALHTLGEAARNLLPLMSVRTRVAAAIMLNVLAAILIVWLPSAAVAWLTLWLVSIAIAGASSWPRLARQSRSRLMPSQHESASAWIEAEEAIEQRPHPIGLIVSIGLLVAGQLVMGSGAQALPTQGATSLGAALNESLKLGLSGDPAMVLGGALLLMVGVAAFAWMTRRSGLEGYPRFRLDAAHPSGGWAMRNWLLVAVLGLVVWLAVLDGVVKDATGWSGVLPWLASVALIGVCWWKIDRVRGIRLALHVDRAEAIALGVALVAAFAVFAFRLGDVPNSLWGDEGGFFTLARDVANGHVTPDFFGLGTYGYPMAGSIYQSIWLGLFGANVWAWRLGSVVAALAAILPLYFLVRATLGRRVAWISIALYAVSPYLLTYARMGYNNAQSITVVVVTMALTWLAVRRDSRLYAFLAGCAGGLGFFTHTSARFGFVLALGWLLWVWITHRARGRSLLMTGGVVLLGVLLVGGPAVAYGVSRYPVAFGDKQAETLFNNVFYARDLYPDEALTASFGLIRVGSQDLFYEPGLYATLLARGIVRTSLSFHTASLVSENYLVGALAEPLGILYLLGLGWCLVRVRRPNYAMWPAWFLVGAFVLSATATFPPRAALMLPIVPALAVLGALGLTLIIDWLAGYVGGISNRVKLFALASAVAVLGLAGLRTYFVDMPERFPPDLDNAIFWQAQQLPRGSDITLIQPDGFPDDYVPWGLRELDLGVNFHLIKPGALTTIDLHSVCANTCRFFFAANLSGQVLPLLQQAFGNGSLVEYPDVGGSVQTYEFKPVINGQ